MSAPAGCLHLRFHRPIKGLLKTLQDTNSFKNILWHWWNFENLQGRYHILFALSRDSLDQSDDALYRIIILSYWRETSVINSVELSEGSRGQLTACRMELLTCSAHRLSLVGIQGVECDILTFVSLTRLKWIVLSWLLSTDISVRQNKVLIYKEN